MTINLQTGGVPLLPLPGTRNADIPIGQKKQTETKADVPTLGSKTADPVAEAQARRYERLKSAAQSQAQNFYPLGDKSFTIFKDASGQYVTRYVSRRDGSVTYIPEARLLREFENRQPRSTPVVKIEV